MIPLKLRLGERKELCCCCCRVLDPQPTEEAEEHWCDKCAAEYRKWREENFEEVIITPAKPFEIKFEAEVEADVAKHKYLPIGPYPVQVAGRLSKEETFKAVAKMFIGGDPKVSDRENCAQEVINHFYNEKGSSK